MMTKKPIRKVVTPTVGEELEKALKDGDIVSLPPGYTIQQQQSRTSLWKGPEEDGITFSLLTRFLACRERFRLRVVEGLREDEGFNHKLEYGSLFHAALEGWSSSGQIPPIQTPLRVVAGARSLPKQAYDNLTQPWQEHLKQYYQKLLGTYPGSEAEITKWYCICRTQFPLYIQHYAKEPQPTPILQEVPFRVPITLPSGRTVTLRGKFDSVCRFGKYIYLQENKTKGEIDELGIARTVDQNLQTMIYQIALRRSIRYGINHPQPSGKTYIVPSSDMTGEGIYEIPMGAEVVGNIYNVIRRPLSDRYAIRQKVKESDDNFYKRLGEVIAADPKHYFYRWKVPLSQQQVDLFCQYSLYPILEQLCDWWEWIKVDPFDPWTPRVILRRIDSTKTPPTETKELAKFYKFDKSYPLDPVNPIHYRTPFGCYNSLFGGYRGDFFNLLTSNSRAALIKVTNLFQELEED